MRKKELQEEKTVLSTKSREKMAHFGKQMKKHGVSHIYFVHGTWTGASPLGFITRVPGIPQPIKTKFEEITKNIVDNVAGDLGNYTESYRELFEKSLGVNILCSRFNWGSGNFHRARVLGAISLIKELASHINNVPGNKRLLLHGHSHAGQLFALLTTFLESEQMAKMVSSGEISMMEQLVNVVGLDGVYDNVAQLKEDIKKIATIFVDIVTFGTPPRYPWGKKKNRGSEENYRLLQVINHHDNPVCITGVPKTKDGDYVQQWGIGNTDFPDKMNNAIEEIIGTEQYYLTAKSLFPGDKRYTPKYEDWILVDNGDNGKSPQESLLGHGWYTLKEKMVFNTELIVGHFYKE